MSDVELGSGSYTPGSGAWDGNLRDAAAQLQPGDRAKMAVTFPVPINFIPGDGIAWLLGPIFAANGQTLEGVDFDGDSTLILVFRMGT